MDPETGKELEESKWIFDESGWTPCLSTSTKLCRQDCGKDNVRNKADVGLKPCGVQEICAVDTKFNNQKEVMQHWRDDCKAFELVGWLDNMKIRLNLAQLS